MSKEQSNNKRILVIGGTGQVAWALGQGCPQDYTLRMVPRQELDLSDVDVLASRVEQLIQSFNPQFIVNAAAYTAVDRAESEENIAFAVNGIAPAIITNIAAQANCPVLHYSTDYVFDGTKSGSYVEDDEPNPVSAYGISKLAGERGMRAASQQILILRTSWVFGVHGSNFLKTMLRLASERDELSVVSDQFGAPTSADLIARVSYELMGAMLDVQVDADDPRWGLYHLTASGETSWHGYAAYLIARAREMGFPVRVEQEKIKPVTSEQFPTAAVRPANSRLDTQLLRSTFGLTLPDWTVCVDEVLGKLRCES
ncbi:dTDP-4-dehydrorhamnose reductase [Orrella marina]|uniref:dTDP-4-dehydrorhamnose reductase n=1 Tax=Orrella marina TaxID=2163011 RepID=A0A2R4XQ53_9BURK|nr:dTDP-4-dehydrorhamnose reductase [Orrella marina]AWB35829.1 dTDP-4-dehydrorhamnose reductase [Orrella marina]